MASVDLETIIDGDGHVFEDALAISGHLPPGYKERGPFPLGRLFPLSPSCLCALPLGCLFLLSTSCLFALSPGCRFFPLPLLENLLDTMAAVKMSVLHLHASDYCRWSVESKL